MKIVLLIESYPEIQTIIKNLSDDIKIIYSKNTELAEEIVKTQKVDLILINIKDESNNIYSFLQKFRNRNSKLKLFAVLPNSKIYISNCIKSGLNDYIEQDKFKEECLLCRIDKLLNLTDENIVEVCSKGNIYINSDTQIAYISGRKIELTESETKIMKYMLEKDKPCTLKDLNAYLGSNINDKSVGMLIYRLTKKMRYILGYSVIKNRYRKGYYIEY